MSSTRPPQNSPEAPVDSDDSARYGGGSAGPWKYFFGLLALTICLVIGLNSLHYLRRSGERSESKRASSTEGRTEGKSEVPPAVPLPSADAGPSAQQTANGGAEASADRADGPTPRSPATAPGATSERREEPPEVVSFDPLPTEPKERVAFLREEIDRTVQALAEAFPQQANPLSLQALVHSRFNRPDLAREVWLQCLELDPNFVSAHAALGTIALEKSDLEEAEGHLRLALERDPGQDQARTSLAECLIKQNRAEEAIELLSEAAESDSVQLIDLYHLGQAHAQLEEFETAISYFRRAIVKAPNLTYAYYGLGTALRRLGEAAQAKEALQKFQELKREDLKSQKELAQSANDESSLRKTAAHVHFITGDVYSKAGQLATAVAHWIRSAKLDSQEVRARENLAQVFMQIGNLQQVVTILEELQEIESQNANHRMNLGMAYLRLGKLDVAQDCFMKAVELSPESSDALMATAEFLVNTQRDVTQARVLAERGVQLDSSARNYEILAMACIALEDFPAGLQAVEQALQQEPDNSRLQSLRIQLAAKVENDKQSR